MNSHRIKTLVMCVALSLAMSCGRQPAQIVAPEPSARSATNAALVRPVDAGGPMICFSNEFLDFCYPGGGYCVCPEAEVPVEVRPGRIVTMNWSAMPEPGTRIHSYRWAVDIDDVVDETPRIDEATDLRHWSARSRDATSATLGPWADGERHRLYVDVMDDQGFRSLGIVRFEVRSGANNAPNCAGASAEFSNGRPRAGSFAPVTINGVTDPDGDPVTITMTDVTQDEPLDGLGDGHTCPDAILMNGAVKVRVERAGTGNGRVYTIGFTAADDHGGSCVGSVDICIPHGQAPDHACTKDALIVSSLGPCPSPPSRARQTVSDQDP